MKKIVLFFLFNTFFLVGQNRKIDSLNQVLKATKNDSIKVGVYNQLTWIYIFNDKKKALEILNTTENIALKTNQKYGYNTFLNNKGVFYDVNGMSDSAKTYFQKAVYYSIKNNYPVQEQYSYNNLGMYAWNKGQFKEALNFFFRALKLSEKNSKKDNSIKVDATLNNIGLIYQEMELFKKAIPYHQKALKIRSQRKFSQGEASSYNNLGICFKQLNNISEAQKYFENGIKKSNEAQDKVLYFNNLLGLAQIFAIKNNNQKALSLLLESYYRNNKIPFNSNDKIKVASEIASLYLKLKQYQKAIDFGEISVNLINAEPEKEVNEVSVYKILAKAHFNASNLDKGNYYNNLFYEKTSLKFKESTAKALQELETKYETETKELALVQAKNENLINENKIRSKNYLLFSVVGFAFLLALIGYFVYKQQRLKNRQMVKENQLKQALIEIENQNNLQEQRLEISKDLHDNIGSQLTFIISSLDNLKYFDFKQDKLYGKFDNISNFTRNTITDLRDTIWAMNQEEITFEDLQTRITNFIEAAKTSLLGITFEFNYPNNLQTIIFNSKKGIDVYRIIQEAVNNAIKHANATKIEVRFEQLQNAIEVSVLDNGSGFDMESIKLGNGLNSMKLRAKDIPSQLEIQSLDQGTKVSFII
jgi:signal transduction histidine kinase